MSVTKGLGLIAVAALLAGCATGPQVRSDYDTSADFSRYRTFGFVSPAGTDKNGYSTLVTERLKRATQGQMEMRGYTYSAADPDLLVNFNTRIEEKTRVSPSPFPAYYGYRGGFYGGWPGYAWGDEVYRYSEGTVNVDLVDARKKQLVWEGVTSGQVDDASQAMTAKNLDQSVADIFTRYPFRAGYGQSQLPNGNR